MSGPLRVFICSTYRDLSGEREGVMEAIRRLQHLHDSMEYFGARPNLPIETCLDQVRRSDVMIVIVGHLYGSIVPEAGVSYTEAEYNEGVRLGKPCLVYMRDEDALIPPKYMEQDPEKIILLKKFKEMLRKNHTFATYTSTQDLCLAVATDLGREAEKIRIANIETVEQHVQLLRRGIGVWNEWRLKHSKHKPILSGADLHGLDLTLADLRQADLTSANLAEAILIWTNFGGANLTKADLTGALLGDTIFGDTDLSHARGLSACVHGGPSTIDFRTLKRSGKLPTAFLKGCQLSESIIEYLDALLSPPIDFYSCFISYSSKDENFAARLHADLQSNGVRCWFAPHDMKIGARLRSEVDEVIRIHDKLLLILSEDSVSSYWTEAEVETALERERRENRTVLFPIRIDDAIMIGTSGWAATIRRMRHIGDFTNWTDPDSYSKAFERLLRDLKVVA
jgi:hypothetical protein